MADCLIALGANLGDREENLEKAVSHLRSHSRIIVSGISSWHHTAPVGGPAGQGTFLNGASRLQTDLRPSGLLRVLQQVERQLGRTNSLRWAARALDLDILLYDDLEATVDDGLRIPHPRMATRRFVLAPANEVASDMVHPTTGWTVRQLLNHLDSSHPYFAIASPVLPPTEIHAFANKVSSQSGSILVAQSETNADLTGLGLNASIELLAARSKLLVESDFASEFSVVTPFWFEQMLVSANRSLSKEDFVRYQKIYEATSSTFIHPRLLILIDHAGSERASAIAIRHQIRQWKMSPILTVDASDLDSAVNESAAAIESMR